MLRGEQRGAARILVHLWVPHVDDEDDARLGAVVVHLVHLRAKRAERAARFARPHSGREKAAVVRIETLPSPTNGLRLYKHLEINFYPNVQHTIIVQITKDLSNLFMAYFLGADDQLDGDDNYVGDSDDDEESTHQVRSERSELGSDGK